MVIASRAGHCDGLGTQPARVERAQEGLLGQDAARMEGSSPSPDGATPQRSGAPWPSVRSRSGPRAWGQWARCRDVWHTLLCRPAQALLDEVLDVLGLARRQSRVPNRAAAVVVRGRRCRRGVNGCLSRAPVDMPRHEHWLSGFDLLIIKTDLGRGWSVRCSSNQDASMSEIMRANGLMSAPASE